MLAKALKTCRKAKKKSKRVSCEKQARKKYGPEGQEGQEERQRSGTGALAVPLPSYPGSLSSERHR